MNNWCEHMQSGKVFCIEVGHLKDLQAWHFCPICGTPRPTEKSLSEEFKTIINSLSGYLNEVAYCRYHNQPVPNIGIKPEEACDRLVEIARQHYESKQST